MKDTYLTVPIKISVSANDEAKAYLERGMYKEARKVCRTALKKLDPCLEWAQLTNTLISVELYNERYTAARTILQESALGFELITDDLQKGNFHYNFGICLMELGELDSAWIEMAGARDYYRRAGRTAYCADVSNSLGMLLILSGNAREALQHLDAARDFYERSSEANLQPLGMIYESYARAYQELTEYDNALKAIEHSIMLLEQAGEREQWLVSHKRRAAILKASGQFDLMMAEIAHREEELAQRKRELYKTALCLGDGGSYKAARILNMKHGQLQNQLTNHYADLSAFWKKRGQT